VVRLFWVCLGGAIGTGARYLLSGWALNVLGSVLPYGTLAVNLLGSFFLALLMYAGAEASAIQPTMRLALTTGVLGGFTTYSTFSFETMRYMNEGAWLLAWVNVLITVLGCLAASFLGWASGRWMFGM